MRGLDVDTMSARRLCNVVYAVLVQTATDDRARRKLETDLTFRVATLPGDELDDDGEEVAELAPAIQTRDAKAVADRVAREQDAAIAALTRSGMFTIGGSS